MPIYEYLCSDCGRGFEQLQLRSRETVSCPGCNGRKVERRLSVFSYRGSAPTAPEDGAVAPLGGCGCTPSTCGCH